MRMLAFFAFGVAATALSMAFAKPARAEQPTRISGPYVHDNLAIYFVHGESAPGPAPLTLQEAFAKGSIQVIETGSVNELKIENTGSEEVFIQYGDIVKGGRQDRVLTVSFVLAPKSGKVPIASYCVEHGRWSSRGREDATKFSSAEHAMPSRSAKLAMKEPAKPEPSAAEAPAEYGGQMRQSRSSSSGYSVGDRQQKVWGHVAETQGKLAAGLNADVSAPQSSTSLQLSLENEKLEAAQGEYTKALQDKGEAGDDIVGFVFAVNGHVNSADVYPSNGLFRKMWSKLLAASVTEAIGEKKGEAGEAPTVASVQEFLVQAEKGKAEQQDSAHARQETRDSDASLYVESKRQSGAWVHRNYLKK
jgi:hypothetical protein